ncbi:hypothetical protein EXU57_09485 [Segetibacter sp. 3557_3]|uniref:FkbM family methyltransferase n=1 Tax=Segetibacter sp. 3557_3 TaxID=2547429 RepID=UPI0010584C03|nr:FkbM family methyltransferase [Segetibacter sp. 3557_3]TDH27022.1 hypothetical protein EXU57_09485 [Segetibacter sp. 3557_3]
MISKIKAKVKTALGGILAQHQQDYSQVQQVQLANQYRLMKKTLSAAEMPRFTDVGFKVYSQFEEDGILLYIFSVIGTTNKQVVEICAGDGIQCMAANLVINHGWTGLLFDGDAAAVEQGNRFFRSNQSTWLYPPAFRQAWITRENINQLITNNGFMGEIDLLSLDIDGNDYHIMEAITVVKPRVIICETHNVIPAHLALTIPYKSDFNMSSEVHHEFRGASLLAMQKLLKTKGYRLVGGHRYGFNALFISEGVGTEYFPEVSVASVYDNAYTRHRMSTAWPGIKDLPWVSV